MTRLTRTGQVVWSRAPCIWRILTGTGLIHASIFSMDYKLTSLSAVLERADSRLRSPDGGVRLWPTGFPLLDDAIGGGFRSGTLNLIAGPQGQGKTMFALQAARAAVKSGRSAVFFSYELEADALTQRLVAMEAGEIDPYEAPNLSEVRAIFEGTSGGAGGLIERMAATPRRHRHPGPASTSASTPTAWSCTVPPRPTRTSRRSTTRSRRSWGTPASPR